MTGRIRWGRVIGLAFALEAALFVTLVPLISRIPQNVLFVLIGIGCAVFGFIAGWLAARGLPSRGVLHGSLVGVLATIIYLVLCVVGPGGIPAAAAFYGTLLFVSLNALRIAGSTAGAVLQISKGRR